MAEQRGNPIERIKAEKDGLDIIEEIEELAAQHGGWETMEPGDRERLKWVGTFFRKPTPGRFMMRLRITMANSPRASLAPWLHFRNISATAFWTSPPASNWSSAPFGCGMCRTSSRRCGR